MSECPQMSDPGIRFAPGLAGHAGRWTSSAKTASVPRQQREPRLVHPQPRHPQRDLLPARRHACTRDMGMIVTDGRTFFSEEKRDARPRSRTWPPGVPAYAHTNQTRAGATESRRKFRRSAARRRAATNRSCRCRDARRLPPISCLLAPHLGNRGAAKRPGWTTTRARRCSSPSARVGAGAGLLCAVAHAVGGVRRRLRWMAGAARSQTTHPYLRPRRGWQRRAAGRGRSAHLGRRVRARDRFRADGHGGGPARGPQPDVGLRRASVRVHARLAVLAQVADLARSDGPASCILRHQRRRPADARRPARAGRASAASGSCPSTDTIPAVRDRWPGGSRPS